MANLLALADELLRSIISLTPPEDIINLACTNKRLLNCSTDYIQRHRELHAKYRLVHDRDPLSIVNTLRAVIRNPSIAWHIRKIEIWGARPDFSFWRPYTLNTDGVGTEAYYDGPSYEYSETAPDIFAAFFKRLRDFTHLDRSFFAPEELTDYGERLQTLGLDQNQLEQWLSALECGNDEPLKVMLISMCQNLKSLAYVTYKAHEYGSPIKHPLGLMTTVIRNIVASPSKDSKLWPPGFCSLRRVVIAETTKHLHPHDQFLACTADVTPYFLLPSLQSIKLNLVGFPDSDTYVWEWDSGHSNVRQIEMYCCNMSLATIQNIFNACGDLQSLLDDNGKGIELFHSLPEQTKRTLEHVDIKVLEHRDTLKIAKNLTSMPHLLHLSLSAHAFLALLRQPPKDVVNFDYHEEEEQEGDAKFLTPEQYLPSAIETLEVHQYRNAHEKRSGTSQSESNVVIEQLLKIVQRKKDKFPRLSSLCYVMFRSADGMKRAFDVFGVPFQENFALLSRLGRENEIALHLSELDMQYCPTCKRREKSEEGGELEPVPAIEYSDYTGRDLTSDYCMEALNTKSVDEVGAKLYEKHVLT